MNHTIRQSAISDMVDPGLGCPLRASYRYGLGVPALEGPTPAAPFIGNTFHLTYAAGYRAKLEGDEITEGELLDGTVTYFDNRSVAEGEQPVEEVDWGEKTENQHRVDLLAMVSTYYPVYQRTQPKVVEHPVSKSYRVGNDDVMVTTRLDLGTTNGWVLDLKTSNVGTRRNGEEYFYAYSEDRVKWKPQPFIHLALLGKAVPYAYHVVGKGNKALFEEVRVPHSQAAVDRWEQHVLQPALSMLVAGIFPAKPGSHCSYCPLAKDAARCGMLL